MNADQLRQLQAPIKARYQAQPEAARHTFRASGLLLSDRPSVHIDTRFTRYRKDGSVIGGFDSIYIVTLQDGHWGVKIRSSFAP